jgi:two-component system nitrogen regulation response regulator GlnG
VNLAAVPASIAASELFGHASGAFTGASAAHAGYFAQAQGGTLFLDEIGAASLEVQAMLLRALETREIQPLGSERRREVEVRVLAATDEDLELAIRAGRFREALYQRLCGYHLDVPPLRSRRDDLGVLLLHFLSEELRGLGELHRLEALAGSDPWLPPSLVARLARSPWPGNVRQLANVGRRLAVEGRGGRRVDEAALGSILPDRVQEAEAPGARPPEPSEAPSAIGEERLRAALQGTGWRIGATARALGISRTSLYALIDASPSIRKAKDVPVEELRACHAELAGDVEAMAERLRVSSRGIRLRLKELGLAEPH